MNTSSLLCLCLFILIFSCAQEKKGNTTFPPHYATEPTVANLEKGLEEISGLSFDATTNSVYAICDDKASLYELSVPDGKVIRKLKFYEGKDYEDLAIVGDTCYVLNSTGNILSFNYRNGDVADAVVHEIPEGGKNELEILYRDKGTKNLILICKDCQRDTKKEVSTFIYNTATGHYADGPFSLDAKGLIEKSEVEKKRFKPSAAAVHPITGELYIISSINQLLVVTSLQGVVKQTYTLDPGLFKHPEGIAFTPSGDMIISNEHGDKGSATLLYYKYSK
jgi:uncharacterized protein YjiK